MDIARSTFGTLVAQTSRHWRRAVDRRLQPFGLTQATWLPLLHLARASAPMRQKDLAASLALDGSSVVRLLDALQAAGLAERRAQDNDRRVKVIVLTSQGRAIVERVQTVAQQVRQDALAGLSDRDIATASQVLDHVCGVLALEEQEPAS